MEERIATGPMAPRNDKIIDVPVHQQRSLATVTAEIRTIRAARDKMFLEASVEIGRRLKEAKELVGHGGWGDYCKTELDFSQQTAQNHIKLFEAYAAEQIRLDGAALKSKAFGNLSYTQALALLALPSEEEREEFVKTHDLGTMSTRELREELRRRTEEDPSTGLEAGPPPLQAGEDSAGDGAADPSASRADVGNGPYGAQNGEAGDPEQAQKALKFMTELRKQDKARLEEIEAQAYRANLARDEALKAQDAAERAAAEAEDRIEAADRKAQEAAEQVSALQIELNKARKAEDRAKRELEKAKANKTAPPEVLEKLRKEAEAAAEARHKADSEELKAAKHQYVKAEGDLVEARQEAARAREAAERLEKELRLAAPEMAAFRVRFEAAQEAINKAVDSCWALPSDKVDGGVRALRALLDGVGKRLEEERYEEAMPE